MKKVTIWLKDEINCALVGLDAEHHEVLVKKFSFFTKNYFFNPKFKLGIWDGKIGFYTKTGQTYIYLLKYIVPRLRKWKYEIDIKDDRSANNVEPALIDKDIFADVLNEHDEPFELRPYQVEAINAVVQNGGGIMIAGTGAGKAQDLNSKVLTTDGWMRMGDLTVGMRVITPTGKTSSITGVFPQGTKDIYEIVFHDGSKARCCKEHLWTVKKPKKLWRADTEVSTIQTQDIIEFLDLKNSNTRIIPGNISIPVTDPIPQPTQSLSVDPYLLGCLIGNGSLTSTTPCISTIDESLVDEVAGIVLRDHGLMVRNVDGVSYQLSNLTKKAQVQNDLREQLKTLDLWGKKSDAKFIPSIYLMGDIQQRWSLLQGLMDTDGTVDKTGKSISYTTVSSKLAKQVQELCWSLGGTCTITNRETEYTNTQQEKVAGQTAYTCFMEFPDPSNVFRLSRKAERCVKYGNGRIELTRRVMSVTKVSNEPAQCIMIDDPDHLYITDDYVVTHNTAMSAAISKLYGDLGLKAITIVPSTTLVQQSADDFKRWGLDCGQYCGDVKELGHEHMVTTWQSLQNVPTILKDFDVVIVDECLAPGTQISTPDGNKSIEDLRPGDSIHSINDDGSLHIDTVVKLHTNLMKSESAEMFRLIGENGEVLEVTGNHKVNTCNGMVEVYELQEGDEIIDFYPGMTPENIEVMNECNTILQQSSQSNRIISWIPTSGVELSNGYKTNSLVDICNWINDKQKLPKFDQLTSMDVRTRLLALTELEIGTK